MRFMVIVKASKNSEAGVLPSKELLTAMGKFNDELTKAGVMLSGEGLRASSKGARVKFIGDKRIVTDGPFAETKELVAGFWLWKCKSLQEAIDWVKRCPNPMPGEEGEIEIRQVFEPEDFSEQFQPEHRKEAKRIYKRVSRQRSSVLKKR
ncbi:MAG TPA: YciI family protein [Candidatus Binatia bacterium]